MRILQIRVLVTRRRGRIRLRGCSLDAPTSEYDNPFSIARATETSEAAARPRTRALAGTNQYVGAGAVAVPADFFRCTEPMGCRWTRQGCGLRSQSSTTFQPTTGRDHGLPFFAPRVGERAVARAGDFEVWAATTLSLRTLAGTSPRRPACNATAPHPSRRGSVGGGLVLLVDRGVNALCGQQHAGTGVIDQRIWQLDHA